MSRYVCSSNQVGAGNPYDTNLVGGAVSLADFPKLRTFRASARCARLDALHKSDRIGTRTTSGEVFLPIQNSRVDKACLSEVFTTIASKGILPPGIEVVNPHG